MCNVAKGLHTLHTSSFDLLFLEQITQLEFQKQVPETFAVYAGLKLFDHMRAILYVLSLHGRCMHAVLIIESQQ